MVTLHHDTVLQDMLLQVILLLGMDNKKTITLNKAQSTRLQCMNMMRTTMTMATMKTTKKMARLLLLTVLVTTIPVMTTQLDKETAPTARDMSITESANKNGRRQIKLEKDLHEAEEGRTEAKEASHRDKEGQTELKGNSLRGEDMQGMSITLKAAVNDSVEAHLERNQIARHDTNGTISPPIRATNMRALARK